MSVSPLTCYIDGQGDRKSSNQRKYMSIGGNLPPVHSSDFTKSLINNNYEKEPTNMYYIMHRGHTIMYNNDCDNILTAEILLSHKRVILLSKSR